MLPARTSGTASHIPLPRSSGKDVDPVSCGKSVPMPGCRGNRRSCGGLSPRPRGSSRGAGMAAPDAAQRAWSCPAGEDSGRGRANRHDTPRCPAILEGRLARLQLLREGPCGGLPRAAAPNAVSARFCARPSGPASRPTERRRLAPASGKVRARRAAGSGAVPPPVSRDASVIRPIAGALPGPGLAQGAGSGPGGFATAAGRAVAGISPIKRQSTVGAAVCC